MRTASRIIAGAACAAVVLVTMEVAALNLGQTGGNAAFVQTPPSAAQTAPSQRTPAGGLPKATFAAGCFWCVEADFHKVPGVVSVTSGFTGGTLKNPTYEQVSAGGTGHAESVEVVYDPKRVTYEQLLDFYWHHVDPFTSDRQFCDVGDQYRAAIFYHGAEQKQLAEQSKARIEAYFKRPVAVQIVPASTFYRAEEYHQHYYLKNPERYRQYRVGCGRDRRLEQIWGKSQQKQPQAGGWGVECGGSLRG
jgi:peptide-methionine (S)-S-oxide reductase